MPILNNVKKRTLFLMLRKNSMDLFVGIALSISVLVTLLSPFVSRYSVGRPANGEVEHLKNMKEKITLIEKKHRL